jgi:glycosyltransferase involved in cell wall biosynthesis
MEKLHAEARRLGVEDKILWLGYRQDVPDLLGALDLYVLASLDEMFPVGVLEAMASGKPIVVTRVGGTPECLPNDRAGILVPPANVESLAKTVIDLLCDEGRRTVMGAAARAAVEQHFTVEALTPQIEALFARVVERRQGPHVGRPG